MLEEKSIWLNRASLCVPIKDYFRGLIGTSLIVKPMSCLLDFVKSELNQSLILLKIMESSSSLGEMLDINCDYFDYYQSKSSKRLLSFAKTEAASKMTVGHFMDLLR